MTHDNIKHGRHWELTSYEWNPRTGVARFGYTHRYTAARRDVIQMQATWLSPVKPVDVNSPHERANAMRAVERYYRENRNVA